MQESLWQTTITCLLQSSEMDHNETVIPEEHKQSNKGHKVVTTPAIYITGGKCQTADVPNVISIHIVSFPTKN